MKSNHRGLLTILLVIACLSFLTINATRTSAPDVEVKAICSPNPLCLPRTSGSPAQHVAGPATRTAIPKAWKMLAGTHVPISSLAATGEAAMIADFDGFVAGLYAEIVAYLGAVNAERIAEAQRIAEEARQASLSRARPTPVAMPQTNYAPGDSVWDALAQCEAGGNWAINTGNGYSGGLQWLPGTWQAYRADSDPWEAWQASRDQQIAAGDRLVAASGGTFRAWPGCRAKLGLP